MRLRKIFITFVILLASFQICFGQEKPKAILVNEFSKINCDDFLARIDIFYIQLQNNPTSQGYAVISGDNSSLRLRLAYELWMNGQIKFRRYDDSRIVKVRSRETGELKMQLWIVPSGAEKPDFNETNWNFIFPPKTKPFIFHDDFEQICSSAAFEKVFAEYLAANPNSRAHIVIYGKSFKEFGKEKKKVQNLLSKIPTNRVRYFFVKKDYSNIEYWLVPRKEK